MSISFADVIRVAKPACEHKETFHAFCECCGLEVKPCTFCFTRPEFINSWCRECYNNYHPIHGFTPYPAETPHFFCGKCEKWNDLKGIYGWEMPSLESRFEIVGYTYKPYCKSCPLSPSNYIRQPYVSPIISNIRPTPELWRTSHAGHAYTEEMKFSGNKVEALQLWFSFFRDSRVEYSERLKEMRKQNRKRLAKALKLFPKKTRSIKRFSLSL